MHAANVPINIEQIIAGQKAAVASALNLIENRSSACAAAVSELTEALSKKARHQRHLIGISGPPGVGKSSMISRLIEKYRGRNQTVGVLSVDPSSWKTGGALLGDRIRMQYDPGDPGVFIRSMAAGNHLGGLAWNTRLNLMVFEAAYDKIILETVGVGQSETEIEHVVDTVVVVIQPGSGDVLQFMKAGIMEIPHILVINKADQKELATKAFNELNQAAMYELSGPQEWKMEVVMTSAHMNTGFEGLVDAIQKHRYYLEENDIAGKRNSSLCRWVMTCFKERFGTFGLDQLGGVAKVLSLLNRTGVNDPLAGMQLLADCMNKKLGLS